MADEPKAGDSVSEGAGDSAAADAAHSEARPGAGSGADDGQRDPRDEYIERLEEAARKAEEAIARLSAATEAPRATAATPPTASRGDVAEFEREAQAIANEKARLEHALRTEGATAANLIAHNELTSREARFYAQLNAKALELTETERAVDGAGSEKGWREFARSHPGVPLDILRDAFLKRHEQAKPPEKPKLKTRAADSDERVTVNVSGSSEVSAGEKKARTVTSEEWATRKRELISKGDFETLSAEAAKIRSGDTILK
jgi:hypothetical protein